MDGDVEKSPDRKRDRLIKRVILILQVAILALVLAFAIYYIQNRQSLTSLPTIRAFARGLAPHYLFSMYDVTEPRDVATSPDGQRIYAAESSGERKIRVYDRQGNQLQAITPPPLEFFTNPAHMVVGLDGNLYVADRGRYEITVYAPDGTYLRSYKNTEIDGGLTPAGLALRPDGNLIVVDSTKERILTLDPAGSLLAKAQLKRVGETQPVYAEALALDRRGRIYVADTRANDIQVLDQNGSAVPGPAGTLATIGFTQGLYIDGYDLLYVVDTLNDNVTVVDISTDNPKKVYTFGDSGIGDGQFRYPGGITMDASGRIYIADRLNNRVQVWSY